MLWCARTRHASGWCEPGQRIAISTVRPRPTRSGIMLHNTTFGWPLVLAGSLKVVYDLTLLRMFQHVKPPEER